MLTANPRKDLTRRARPSPSDVVGSLTDSFVDIGASSSVE
jgi:hypothetical protein